MGGTPNKRIEPLHRLQKKCIRILFGDLEKYFNKFCTAARTRPFGEQKLGSDFYIMRDHTKPIFNEQKILTIHNLHKYMTVNEILNILKNRTPCGLYELLKISKRNEENIILLPKNKTKTNQFLYTASKLWNITIKRLKVPHFNEISVSVLKSRLKTKLLNIQKSGDPDLWTNNNMIY